LERLVNTATHASGGRASCIAFLDIDRLHLINQTYGFARGDEVIRTVAQLLAPPLLPRTALVARTAGDCFVLFLPACDSRTAPLIITRVQEKASRVTVGPSGQSIEVSLSCGIAALRHEPDGFLKALSTAEVACRAAKERGRNRIAVHDTSDSGLMQRHHDVAAVGVLHQALNTGQFALYAQKIVALASPGRTSSYELLTRVRETDGRLVSLGDYIPVAQRYQLLTRIDRWIAENALDWLAPHGAKLARLEIGTSLNITGQSAGDPEFVHFLLSKIKRSGISPHNIVIEITEQAAAANFERAGELMRHLCASGCRIALDDFGTGANTLAHLKGFPVARVKLDGSFIRDIGTNRRSIATVRAVVQLAKSIGADTVAEFVETQEIAGRLRELGVDYGQGFAFGKPEPLESVLARLGRVEEPSKLPLPG
jgi:diguanylate cyclase (GGDEF)-like protein